jgi:hypothetical protein
LRKKKILFALLFTKEIPILIRDEEVPYGEMLVDLLDVILRILSS